MTSTRSLDVLGGTTSTSTLVAEGRGAATRDGGIASAERLPPHLFRARLCRRLLDSERPRLADLWPLASPRPSLPRRKALCPRVLPILLPFPDPLSAVCVHYQISGFESRLQASAQAFSEPRPIVIGPPVQWWRVDSRPNLCARMWPSSRARRWPRSISDRRLWITNTGQSASLPSAVCPFRMLMHTSILCFTRDTMYNWCSWLSHPSVSFYMRRAPPALELRGTASPPEASRVRRACGCRGHRQSQRARCAL